MTVYIIAALIAVIGILSTLLAIKASKLKIAQNKLDSKTVELSIKQQELEVVRDLQEKFKTSKQKKTPERIAPPVVGDSDSRIARLNRVSNSQSKT